MNANVVPHTLSLHVQISCTLHSASKITAKRLLVHLDSQKVYVLPAEVTGTVEVVMNKAKSCEAITVTLTASARAGILNSWIGNEADIRLNYGIPNFHPCCA